MTVMNTRVVVPYEHHERDLQTIYIAVTRRPLPSADEWRPVYRDTIDGKRVVWARFPDPDGAVWLRDRDGGDRQVKAGAAKKLTPSPQTGPARSSARQPTRSVNPNARWEASVISNRMPRHDSVEPLMIKVTAPVALPGLDVQVGVEARDTRRQKWAAAVWLDVAGGEGIAVANLGEGDLTVAPGRYTALVKVTAGGTLPVVPADTVVVQ